MYEAECSAVERGISFAQLMEKAGSACAGIIFDEYCREGTRVLVISGKGKNGGDGFVIARHLLEKGCAVKVYLPCGRPSGGIAADNMNLVDESLIYEDDFSALISESEIIVDAVYGTGFRGSLDEKCSALARAVNESGKTVVSIDIPSGAECDTARVNGEVFKADMTIAISAVKPVHVMKPSKNVCGRVVTADISITEEDFKKAGGALLFTYTDEDIKKILPARPEVSNKGTFGNALCIAGSRNMPGAAKIASAGAVRSGAGLVTLAFPDAAYNAIAPCVTEQVMLPCESAGDGTFSASASDKLINKASACTACLAGCGLGVNEDTKELVFSLIRSVNTPLLLDADALNCVSENPDILKEAKAPVIITPHPGEMSRLTKKSIDEILSAPVTAAKEFAGEYGCTVVLKGANTVICENGTSEIYINANGNSGLAKGGSGDLLSGIIVSLLAQGMKPFDAACAGVYIHGGCADETAGILSKRGMTVTDITGHLPVYLNKFEKDGDII